MVLSRETKSAFPYKLLLTLQNLTNGAFPQIYGLVLSLSTPLLLSKKPAPNRETTRRDQENAFIVRRKLKIEIQANITKQ